MEYSHNDTVMNGQTTALWNNMNESQKYYSEEKDKKDNREAKVLNRKVISQIQKYIKNIKWDLFQKYKVGLTFRN